MKQQFQARNERQVLAPAQHKADFPMNLVCELLRFEYTRCVQRNPRYSQRSFAKQIGISHTLLSLILAGKRKPTETLVEKLSERFDYSPEKLGLLRASLTKQSESNSNTSKKVEDEFSLDQFALISEWQHYAILSLLEIKDTKFEPEFIAKRLGISPLLAKISMQRLVNLEIVAQDRNGKWKQKSAPIIINDSKSTSAGKKFQRQLISKAVESMLRDQPELRDVSSTTFAMHSKHIPYAIKKIREFRRQLSSELEMLSDPEEVYNITIQIFPTSKRGPR